MILRVSVIPNTHDNVGPRILERIWDYNGWILFNKETVPNSNPASLPPNEFPSNRQIQIHILLNQFMRLFDENVPDKPLLLCLLFDAKILTNKSENERISSVDNSSSNLLFELSKWIIITAAQLLCFPFPAAFLAAPAASHRAHTSCMTSQH